MITRPPISPRLWDHAGPYGIQLDVAVTEQQIPLAIDKGGPVAAFPKRAGVLMPIIKIAYIGAPEALHDVADAPFVMWRHQQMHMVGHEHIGVYLTMMALAGVYQLGEVDPIILISCENGLAVVTPLNNVLRMSGQDEARETRRLSCVTMRRRGIGEDHQEDAATGYFEVGRSTSLAFNNSAGVGARRG